MSTHPTLESVAPNEPYAAARSWGLLERDAAPVAGQSGQAVSVIGARAATAYDDFVATEIGYTLGSASMTVMSGAAHGIDGAATARCRRSSGSRSRPHRTTPESLTT